jgi:hypothetical protein
MKIDRKKTIYILGIILVIQILILVFSNIFSLQNIKTQSIEKPLIKDLKKENITSFEIKDASTDFSIEKKDNQWFVKSGDKSIPGNEPIISAYIDTISKLPNGVVIYNGSDASSDKTYGFTDKKYQTLIVKTNNKKDFKLMIGYSGASRSSSFVKFENEKKIRELNSSIAGETGNMPILWAVKRILENQIKPDDIKSCEISSNFSWFKGNYKIIKDDKGKYTIEPPVKGGTLDEEILKMTINSIPGFIINDYKLNENVSGKTKTGSLKITEKSGKEITLDFYNSGEKEGSDFLLKTSLTDFVYSVSGGILTDLFKDSKNLIKKDEKK